MLVKLSAGGAAAAQAVYSEYAVELNVESEQPWQRSVRNECNAVASARRCSRTSTAAIYLNCCCDAVCGVESILCFLSLSRPAGALPDRA